MCCEKSFEALGAPSDGRSSARTISDERAAGMPGTGDGTWNVSLQKPSGILDRAEDADTRDRTEQSALRLPQDPCAAEPRGLEGRQVSGVSAVQGRRAGAEEAATAQEKGGAASRRKIRGYSTERGVESGFRCRSTARWQTVPCLDHRRCLYPGERGHRSGTKSKGRRRSANPEPFEVGTGRAEISVLRQWKRIHQSRDESMGLSEWGEDRLLSTRQADGQCVHRIIQRNLPGRMPEYELVSNADRCKTDHSCLEGGI